MSKPEHKTYLLRLPPDLMKWLKGHALQRDRSINRQLIHMIRHAMEGRTNGH